MICYRVPTRRLFCSSCSFAAYKFFEHDKLNKASCRFWGALTVSERNGIQTHSDIALLLISVHWSSGDIRVKIWSTHVCDMIKLHSQYSNGILQVLNYLSYLKVSLIIFYALHLLILCAYSSNSYIYKYRRVLSLK